MNYSRKKLAQTAVFDILDVSLRSLFDNLIVDDFSLGFFLVFSKTIKRVRSIRVAWSLECRFSIPLQRGFEYAHPSLLIGTFANSLDGKIDDGKQSAMHRVPVRLTCVQDRGAAFQLDLASVRQPYDRQAFGKCLLKGACLERTSFALCPPLSINV